MNKPTLRVILAILAILATMAVASCTKSQAERAEDAVVDCTLRRLRGPIITELVTLIVAMRDKINLDVIVRAAIADLSNIKACALAEYKARQPQNVASRSETADPLFLALERVRVARGGALFQTDGGKI